MLRIIFSAILLLSFISCPAYGVREAVITVESSAFDDGEEIPAKYSLGGKNVSPPISWSGLPRFAKSLAILCEDPDAPAGIWTHWVIFNIPPNTQALPEDLPDDGILPGGMLHGINDFGRLGWDGPAPPEGIHRYVFEVYALNTMLDLGPGIKRSDLLEAMKGHVIGRGRLIGTYER